MFDLTGKVALITGAAGNLGETTARAFFAAGSRLVLVDNRRDRLDQVYADVLDRPECLLPSIDITDEEAVRRMVAETLAHFDRIDIVANIAGGYRAGTPVYETPLNTWEFMVNLNARSVFLVSGAVLPQMLRQRSGRIINVGARVALAARANMGAYAASKSAVIRLTESMAAEVRHQGVNVNCILPGTIDTPANREAQPDADYDTWVQPEALVDVILFLASDAARAINGAAIPVYGRS